MIQARFSAARLLGTLLAPTRTLQTAIDLRTASHVGLPLGYQPQRSFDFVFPRP